MATPFVQGQLHQEWLCVEIETACAHCRQPLHLTVDSEMHYTVREQDATPLVFEPEIDWAHFTKPTIIDDY